MVVDAIDICSQPIFSENCYQNKEEKIILVVTLVLGSGQTNPE